MPAQARHHIARDAVRLIRRLGVAGFLFFLAKGLLWLAVPLLGLKFL